MHEFPFQTHALLTTPHLRILSTQVKHSRCYSQPDCGVTEEIFVYFVCKTTMSNKT
jgi:hypothetical protein